MRRLLLVAAVVSIAVGAAPLSSQQLPYPARQRDAVGRDDRAFSFYDRGPYRPAVPRPEALLGYELGDLNTQFADQQRVLLAIADAAKDRVRVEEIGSSVERRPMRLFIVSHPDNIARLDAIRADLDALSDPRGKTPAQLDQLAARTPAVVMINESVHGNESPGFETAMQTLYQLAASDEPATVSALKNTIVVLNPSSNPDGHERFAVWYNSIHVGAPDNWSSEKDEPWSIVGRSNHYRFNMNRDVAASTQREVQALVRAMLRWHPMVAVDQHGQTTNYFFPPAARPVNVNIGTQSEKWLDRIGRGNAAAFDKYGWMYFVRDAFDLGGPFYYDSWPSLTGATGMTYETDGGGHLGILWKREDGSLLSFRDGIAKHWVAAMATIETTAAGAQERVRDYIAFRRNAVEAGRTERMKRIVLVPGSDPARAAELAATLLRSGIEVRRASAPFSSSRAHAYADDRTASRRFDAGAYVIDLAQPQGRLAKAVLEPADELDPVFGKAMIDKYRRNTQRGRREQNEYYEFYDVTAWSFPVSFGVESYWTEDAAPVSGDLLTVPAEEPPLPAARENPRPGARLRAVGGELLPVDVTAGIVAGRGARSAYLFTSERSGAPRLAWQLMDEGFRVAVSTQPIEAGERDWPRGTYVVRVARNDTTLHARIDALAREAGVEVTGVNTAYTTRAQFGVGSGPVTPLVPAKVAVLGDEGVDVNDYGAIWWTLERRYGVRFAPVNWDGLRRALNDVNVLIMPSGSPGRINQRLGKAGADAIRAWVERGGTLVTMGGASAWAAREDVNLTSARAVGGDTTGTRRDTAVVNDPALAELTGLASPTASNASPQPLPGTNFDVVLDRTHWLTLGYTQPRLTAMLGGDTFLKPSREGTNVAVFPSTGLLVRGGFTWPDNTERLLRGTSLVIDEPTGGGHVIVFNNEPLFRGWWRAMDKLVLNAIVLGPAM